MIQVKLRLLALANFVTVDVDVYVLRFPQNLKPGIYTYRLSDSQVIDGIVTIGHIFQVDECFASQVRLIVIPLDGCHTVLIEAYHPLRNTCIIPIDFWIVYEVPKMIEEGLLLFIFVA